MTDLPWWEQERIREVASVEADTDWYVGLYAHEAPDGWEYALIRASYGSRVLLALFKNGQWIDGDPEFMPVRMAVKLLEQKFRAMGYT